MAMAMAMDKCVSCHDWLNRADSHHLTLMDDIFVHNICVSDVLIAVNKYQQIEKTVRDNGRGDMNIGYTWWMCPTCYRTNSFGTMECPNCGDKTGYDKAEVTWDGTVDANPRFKE
jgi:hypothetical protein